MEFFKLILGALLTLAVGIVALLLTKFFVDPLNEQKKIIAEIASALFYWARVYANPIAPESSEAGEAERQLRSLAGKLVAATAGIRPYWLGRWLGAPSQSAVGEAVEHLIAVSNGVRDSRAGTRNYTRANEVLACLRVKATVTGLVSP